MTPCPVCNQINNCPKLPYNGAKRGSICERIISHYGYYDRGELKVMKKGIEYYKKLIKK